MSTDLEFDPPLTPQQREVANKLSAEAIEEIDAMLLSQASNRYRKVARIVGCSLLELKDKYPGLPDVFYSERVQALVKSGRLEAQGNLRYMRYSEIKLCSS